MLILQMYGLARSGLMELPHICTNSHLFSHRFSHRFSKVGQIKLRLCLQGCACLQALAFTCHDPCSAESFTILHSAASSFQVNVPLPPPPPPKKNLFANITFFFPFDHCETIIVVAVFVNIVWSFKVCKIALFHVHDRGIAENGTYEFASEVISGITYNIFFL